MKVVCNIKESSVRHWLVPEDQIPVIREAYDRREWL